jgi:hypothetical protein
MAGSVSNMSNVVTNHTRSTGKRYAEVQMGEAAFFEYSSPGLFEVGITTLPGAATGESSSVSGAAGGGIGWGLNTSRIFKGASDLYGFSAGRIVAAEDVIRIAADLDAGKLWMALNADAWVGGGDPATDTTPTATFTPGDFFIGASAGNNVSFGPTTEPFKFNVLLHTAAVQMVHAIPTGFVAWAA